jgi:inorganic pyrophosphatase
MTNDKNEPIWTLLGDLFRAHPWHGLHIGDLAPELIRVYIEMLPTDTVKYELDKQTGLLRIDRPQRFSSVCPELYGMVPQTYCGERVAEYCCRKTGRTGIKGDCDPLDICVLTEKHITHANIFMQARPVGGLRMLDGNEADDKIIAILDGDPSYGYWQDISQCPPMVIERLRHYFLTYKQAPDSERAVCEITHVYGHQEALEVIRRAQEDYLQRYGDLADLLRKIQEQR